jgi:3-oxoacyl-[acyl-carrier protein] reductase
VGHLLGESSVVKNDTSGIYPKGLLYGQVAIITGSGQGIGESTAHLFVKEGAKVVVTDIDAVKSDKVAADIISQGHTALSVPGDVTDPNFPQKIIDLTMKSFGKINIIVNNAGYTWDGMLHKITDKQWHAMLEVHNTAPFRLIRAASPYMRELSKSDKEKGLPSEPRCIINVSSTSGLHGNVGQANYATAKLGIIGLTKTIAKEWGPLGIRCNAVAYGLIDTRLTREKKDEVINIDGNKVLLGIPGGNRRDYATIPLNRPGTTEEAAAAVLFLASPLASYVNGHCLEVTGGVGI